MDETVLPENKMKDAQEIIDSLRQEAKHLPEMSLDEINSEISAVRKERIETTCKDVIPHAKKKN